MGSINFCSFYFDRVHIYTNHLTWSDDFGKPRSYGS